eukprot:Protomagalhaensia_sp_Gyna_25__424@NODE_11_length_8872_cov_78_828031_g7_i0_p5_GENE_NODE_11_length_8872_cov_78_828031_g7_i0NODE_11_length_8872_cov_78_828031_g7_i0_p5_ORF_typecomplete_len279_score21_13L27/PF02828_16/0_011CC190/PF15768_5/1_3e04CC190/PF15768_5/0_091DUF1924/PF09086_11/0_35_NODE_11_length_8872_cov_78_828031_g7_i042295065
MRDRLLSQPPLVRVRPSQSTQLPRRREYISLSPARRSHPVSQQHLPQSHSDHIEQSPDQPHTGDASAAGEISPVAPSPYINRLYDIQHKQNKLLREENELLRRELVYLRATLDKRNVQLKSLSRSFHLLGEVVKDNLSQLPSDVSQHFLLSMMNSIHMRSVHQWESVQETSFSPPPPPRQSAKPNTPDTVAFTPQPHAARLIDRNPIDVATQTPSPPCQETSPSIDESTGGTLDSRFHTPGIIVEPAIIKIPKLSLSDVEPSSWLCGENTAGETYTQN